MDSEDSWCSSDYCEEQRKLNEEKWLRETYGNRLQLYEGNFLEWLKMIESVLRSFGLWCLVRYPRKPYIRLNQEQEAEFERDDTWAVNIMLQYVNSIYLARQPIEKPITGYDLLRKLEVGAKPFRLMDLPRELRDKIYEFEVAEIPAHDDTSYCMYPAFVNAATLDWDSTPFADPVPSLLHVSRQVREESAKTYYERNLFRFYYYTICSDVSPLDVVAKWANLVEPQHRKYVRAATLFVYWYKDQHTTIEVCYSPHTGLKAKVDAEARRDRDTRRYFELKREAKPRMTTLCEMFKIREDKYCAMISARKKNEGWDTTGVIEYFTADPAALQRAL